MKTIRHGGGVRKIQVTSVACCALLFFLGGCGGNEPQLVSNQTAVVNANAQSSSGVNNTGAPGTAASKNAPYAPGKSAMGEAIDTREFDSKINRLEEQAKQKPDDAALRKQLAAAYLERGNALTQARQYQPALADYRRTLRYDPSNQEARYWSDTIIGILKQMNREVPAEGAEPTPLKL